MKMKLYVNLQIGDVVVDPFGVEGYVVGFDRQYYPGYFVTKVSIKWPFSSTIYDYTEEELQSTGILPIKNFTEAIKQVPGSIYNRVSGPIVVGSPYCDHKWVDYMGLNEKFTYCTKCDRRKL